MESAHGAHKLNDKSRRTCPGDGEGEGPRNLPRLFSVGADLSTGKARAMQAKAEGKNKSRASDNSPCAGAR